MNSPHADRGGQDGGWRNLLLVLNLIPVPRDNLDIKGRGSLMPFNVGLSIPTHPPKPLFGVYYSADPRFCPSGKIYLQETDQKSVTHIYL